MAIKVVKKELGAFAEGEVPPTLELTYLDSDDVIVDISSFTTRSMEIEAIPAVTGPLGTADVNFKTDGTDGIVTYAWTANDMLEEASYQAQVWVSNGTNKLASDLLIYVVYNGPGSAP